MIHVFWKGVIADACSVCIIVTNSSLLVTLQLSVFLCTRFEVRTRDLRQDTIWSGISSMFGGTVYLTGHVKMELVPFTRWHPSTKLHGALTQKAQFETFQDCSCIMKHGHEGLVWNSRYVLLSAMLQIRYSSTKQHSTI